MTLNMQLSILGIENNHDWEQMYVYINAYDWLSIHLNLARASTDLLQCSEILSNRQEPLGYCKQPQSNHKTNSQY